MVYFQVQVKKIIKQAKDDTAPTYSSEKKVQLKKEVAPRTRGGTAVAKAIVPLTSNQK